MAQDAIALLEADHQRAEALFRDFQLSKAEPATKLDLAQIICMELTMHSALEEELFYPAVGIASGDQQMVLSAQIEHQEVKDLIAQVPAARDLEGIVQQIADSTLRHIQEERFVMFPKARSCGLDLDALGQRMEQRRAEFAAVQAA